MPELSERDIKARQTLPHPDYCKLKSYDCWVVKDGLLYESYIKNEREYCGICQFCDKELREKGKE